MFKEVQKMSDIAFYEEVTENHITENNNTTTVPIDYIDYRNGVDFLDVYVNGIHLTETVDYVKTTNGITLTKGLDKDNAVSFVIRKATAATAEDYETLKGPTGDVSTAQMNAAIEAAIEDIPTLANADVDRICV